MYVAALQMNSTADKIKNLTQAERLIIKAVKENAGLVALPEYFSFFTAQKTELLRYAKSESAHTVKVLKDWAKKYNVWLHGGTVPLIKSGVPRRATNTSFLFSPNGKLAARYDKMHLFDANLAGNPRARESDTYAAGNQCVVADSPFGKLGLSTCYDLRFPELYRIMAKRDVRIFFAPSAFTAFTGKAHWDVLTRARAIENQAYLVAAAQTGSAFPGQMTYGHARIVNPWGEVLQERSSGVGIVMAKIDVSKLEEIRHRLPALKNRKIKISGVAKLFPKP